MTRHHRLTPAELQSAGEVGEGVAVLIAVAERPDHDCQDIGSAAETATPKRRIEVL